MKGSSGSTGLDEGFVIWDDENKDKKLNTLKKDCYLKIFSIWKRRSSAAAQLVLPARTSLCRTKLHSCSSPMILYLARG